MFNNWNEFCFGEEVIAEDFTEEAPSEEELLLEMREQIVSQQQGDWLEGYLDAMDEWEEEEC